MPFDAETIAQRFRRLVPGGLDHASLRVVEEHSNTTHIRQDVLEPADRSVDRGAMVTVVAGDGIVCSPAVFQPLLPVSPVELDALRSEAAKLQLV